jgi:glycerol-1-phosphate dehydrogenase [NAD(P)+]
MGLDFNRLSSIGLMARVAMAGERNPHVIDLPKRIVVGRGLIDKIGDHLRAVFGPLSDIREVLVVSGPTVSRKVFPIVRDSLKEKSFEPELVIASEASLDEAQRIASRARKGKYEVILGLGGGKSIDIAKFAAKEAGVPFVSIPTVASHDGITSPFASLRGFGKPISRPAKPPILILVDVDVIADAPRRYNVAGFGDVIGKFTAVLDWRLAHRLRGEYYGGYAASLALMSARHVSQHVDEIASMNEEGLRVLLEALVSSGVAMCIAGSTRPASGSEHLFAHAVTLLSKNPPLHGELVGLGTIMMSYLHGLNWKKVRRLLQRVGAPVTAEEAGLEPDLVVEALVKAASIRPERYTILGERGLTEQAARRLAKVTGVI